MKTIVVQIGNSDDRLKQSEWHSFYATVDFHVQRNSTAVHFSGASGGAGLWQNACWVCVCESDGLDRLVTELEQLCQTYRQDSIALTVGDTVMLKVPTS